MNIFYLDTDASICATLHCDKHVVKMVTEYAQLLSTAHRILDGTMYIGKTKNGRNVKRWRLEEDDDLLYKASHINHPSAVWVRECKDNYTYLWQLYNCLGEEYTFRYGKQHAAHTKLARKLRWYPKNISKVVTNTQPPPAMKQYPQCVVPGDSIQSYRNYYREAKADIAKWTNRPIPEFMK
jgi:hypothetical protein